MDLEKALLQYDIVDSNLSKLASVWQKMSKLIPSGIAFLGESPEGKEYHQLRRDFKSLLGGLPSIDRWKIETVPMELDEIASCRLSAKEICEIEAEIEFKKTIEVPSAEIVVFNKTISLFCDSSRTYFEENFLGKFPWCYSMMKYR